MCWLCVFFLLGNDDVCVFILLNVCLLLVWCCDYYCVVCGCVVGDFCVGDVVVLVGVDLLD